MDILQTGSGDLLVSSTLGRRSGVKQLDAARREALIAMIQGDVIPATATHIAWSSGRLNDNDAFHASDLRRFRELAYASSAGRPTDRLMQFLDNIKLSAQRKIVFLEAAVRGIGEDWVGDRRTFFDVTLAMGRIQVLLRRLSQALRTGSVSGGERSALLAVPPGEQHIFGLQIVESLFRASGWHTTTIEPRSVKEIGEAAGNGRCDVVCMSWSSEFLAESMATSLRALARLSVTPIIMAGGYAAERNHQWLLRQGVDHVCGSPRAALKLAIEKRRNHDGDNAFQRDSTTQHSCGGAEIVPQVV